MSRLGKTMKLLARLVIIGTLVLVPLLGGCGKGEEAATQTSEVIDLYPDAPPPDPFDKPFIVDNERALRIGQGVAPPRLVSRGPRVRFPSSDRSLCFPSASIIVVVDKTGTVRETEIIEVAPAIEYVDGKRIELTAEESLALIKEREPAIRNWQYEPATQNGQPVPVVVEGGWRMNCR